MYVCMLLDLSTYISLGFFFHLRDRLGRIGVIETVWITNGYLEMSRYFVSFAECASELLFSSLRSYD